MENIYLNGSYLERNPDWHLNDAAWKANHIFNIIRKNGIRPQKVAEIGCGSGGILCSLSRVMGPNTQFYGYDISPQAIALAQKSGKENISFHLEDLLSDGNTEFFDILLVIDVLEHIPDCLDFALKCRLKAQYKIYHIPLDISVFSVARKSFIAGRYQHGHLHYFTFESAMAALKDTEHMIIDYFYTDPASYYFKQGKTFKRAIINMPRWTTAFFSIPLAARVFGRYSLLVLTE